MKKQLFIFISLIMMVMLYGQQKQTNILLSSQLHFNEIDLSKKTSNVFYKQAERARLFSINQAIMQTDEHDLISLNLFHDRQFDAVVISKTINSNGTMAIICQLTDFEYAYGFITIHDGKVLVDVDIPELQEKYLTRFYLNNQYLLKLDNSKLDKLEGGASLELPYNEGTPIQNNELEHLNDNILQNSNRENINVSPSLINKSSVNDTAHIDVMVVYTPAAQTWANSNEGSINNTIAAAMAKGNLAASNSDLKITFNLVYSGLVNYIEETPSINLNRLSGKTDGYMDEIHQIRDSVAADLVVLLSFETTTGGLGYLLNNRYGIESSGFSLTRVQQTSSSYTFIHEIGHNMGAHHHKQQNVQPGPTSFFNWPQNTWSAGWRWTGASNAKYCDIMTYEHGSYFSDNITHTRVPHFSDPNIQYLSFPTGHQLDGDNARTLREVKHYVAQYRDANTLLYCQANGDNPYYRIINVTAGTINNTSTGSYYSDFSFFSTDINQGVALPITVSVENPFSTNQLLVWVDWNDDKDFNDVGEQVYVSSVGSVSQYSFSITPPCGISLGPKRMRIRLHISSNGPNSTPCGSSSHGEVEDYTLNVINTGGGSSINPPISGGNKTYCVGNVIPTINATVGTGNTIDWYNSATGGILLLQGSLVYTPSAAGIYYAETREIASACVSSTRTPITVTENQLPNVNCPTNFELCVDAVPQALSGATPASGVYSGTGVVNGVFNPSVAGIGLQTITYTYQDINNCTNTCTFEITVNALPIVNLNPFPMVCVQDAPFMLSGGSPTGGTYSGIGVTNDMFNPAAAGTGTHPITYSFKDAHACENSNTKNITVDACTFIENNQYELFISPNPAKDFLSIHYGHLNNEPNQIQITSVEGKLVINETILSGQSKTTLDIRSLAKGVYIVSVITSQNTLTSRFVVY